MLVDNAPDGQRATWGLRKKRGFPRSKIKFGKYKSVKLGDFTAHQVTVIEHRNSASVIFYYFKGEGWQDRFHGHAFRSISFCFGGSFRERVMAGEDPDVWREQARRFGFRYYPRECNHMLGKSRGCLTVVMSGPWELNWNEWKDGRRRTLGWGRTAVDPVVDARDGV